MITASILLNRSMAIGARHGIFDHPLEHLFCRRAIRIGVPIVSAQSAEFLIAIKTWTFDATIAYFFLCNNGDGAAGAVEDGLRCQGYLSIPFGFAFFHT